MGERAGGEEAGVQGLVAMQALLGQSFAAAL